MTIDEQIDALNVQIKNLLSDIGRPSGKQAYLDLLNSLESERDVLVAQKAAEVEAAKSTAAAKQAAYEASAEYKILVLDAEYQPKFSEVSQAYMSALILGDDATMVANRLAYHNLLTEYNTKRGAIV